jgi:hypothetical protein
MKLTRRQREFGADMKGYRRYGRCDSRDANDDRAYGAPHPNHRSRPTSFLFLPAHFYSRSLLAQGWLPKSPM